jgi:hypothetical protein
MHAARSQLQQLRLGPYSLQSPPLSWGHPQPTQQHDTDLWLPLAVGTPVACFALSSALCLQHISHLFCTSMHLHLFDLWQTTKPKRQTALDLALPLARCHHGAAHVCPAAITVSQFPYATQWDAGRWNSTAAAFASVVTTAGSKLAAWSMAHHAQCHAFAAGGRTAGHQPGRPAAGGGARTAALGQHQPLRSSHQPVAARAWTHCECTAVLLYRCAWAWVPSSL